eukprot:CAMPEP_0118691966 /NCGR_PEP_ID=MMETSP0800-20121206/10993_1 /TAXON_ID=210618 ORGANISM="Striatella unipunctata, Strain CCMP2910" /NCGR_SAMPLE_ID=MMETSP0800 /ASSEMBLY_ACC=CAM_ASM_000638 /LENGTH=219 /DNA_ID=CAMNT_0006589843 /DNA_START=135 /DNA_END=794 /DNA_ORIENTATION=+
MNRIFGKKKAPGPPPPSLTQASDGMGSRMDSMDAKIASLENELRVHKDKLKKTKSPAAKKLIQKKAMDVLKRKRMYEQQRDQVAAQQFNVDQTRFGIENAKASVDTVAAMKAANTQLKSTIRNDLDIDDIDDLADDMAELMEDFNEINEALGRNYATPDDIDESELDAELEMLEDELEDELEAETPYPAHSLPALPTNAPGGKRPTAKVDEHGLPMQSS